MSELERPETFCICSEAYLKSRELLQCSEHQLIFKQYYYLLVLAYFAEFLDALFPYSTSFTRIEFYELRGENLVHLRAEVTIYNMERGLSAYWLTEGYLLAILMFSF